MVMIHGLSNQQVITDREQKKDFFYQRDQEPKIDIQKKMLEVDDQVLAELKKLPNNYHLLMNPTFYLPQAIFWQNLLLQICQIDYFIVGPTGLGLIDIVLNTFNRNKKNQISPRMQIEPKIIIINTYFSQYIGRNYPIIPIVVTLKEIDQNTGGEIPVILPSMLIPTLKKHEIKLNRSQI